MAGKASIVTVDGATSKIVVNAANAGDDLQILAAGSGKSDAAVLAFTGLGAGDSQGHTLSQIKTDAKNQINTQSAEPDPGGGQPRPLPGRTTS